LPVPHTLGRGNRSIVNIRRASSGLNILVNNEVAVLSEDMTLLDTPIESWDRIRAVTPAASFSPPSCRCPTRWAAATARSSTYRRDQAATPDKGAIE